MQNYMPINLPSPLSNKTSRKMKGLNLPPMKKAVIFDLDGTLANTLTTIAYFANQALEASGFQAISKEKYRYMVGNGAKILVQRMLHENGDDSPESFQKVYPLYNKTYDDNFLYLTAPYDGIPEILAKLKGAGIKLAVLSNKPHPTTSKVAEALFGGDTFDLVCGQKEGVPLKPDPAALFHIMKELGVTAEETVYVGDTTADMQTGKSAGAWTVGVLWGFRDEKELRENHADVIISKPDELWQQVNRA